jgi:hypothetical protein
MYDEFHLEERDGDTHKKTLLMGLEEFNKVCAQVKAEPMTDVLPTKVWLLAAQISALYDIQSMRTPLEPLASAPDHHRGLWRLDVNVYPLKVTEQEQRELEEVLPGYFKGINGVSVKVINVPYEQLTPDHMSSTYYAAIVYRVSDWMSVQANAIKLHRQMSTAFYAPRICETIITPEGMEIARNSGIDPFEYTTQAMSQVVPICYVSTAFFCADTPDNLSEYTTPELSY